MTNKYLDYNGLKILVEELSNLYDNIVQAFDSTASFPSVGNENIIYIDIF